MCGFCGRPRGQLHWSAPLSGVDTQRSRLQKLSFLNVALSTVRLRARDFSGTAYVISGATGKSLVAYDMDAFWNDVEILCGHAIDPFDPVVYKAMESA